MKLNELKFDELYPTEKVGPSVVGTVEYEIEGQSECKAAYILTNERLIMNALMKDEVYQRNIPYNAIQRGFIQEDDLFLQMGEMRVKMKDIIEGDKEQFVEYLNEQLNK
mgnify:CR=1 FL=1